MRNKTLGNMIILTLVTFTGMYLATVAPYWLVWVPVAAIISAFWCFDLSSQYRRGLEDGKRIGRMVSLARGDR